MVEVIITFFPEYESLFWSKNYVMAIKRHIVEEYDAGTKKVINSSFSIDFL
ncbi:MAG: hypothetical protein KAQ92_04460 [Candidatus Aenigmarchaeota archaeon]|nr:hypothetical protein [Candidatus Aenigmarchaeota archaeon]